MRTNPNDLNLRMPAKHQGFNIFKTETTSVNKLSKANKKIKQSYEMQELPNNM